MRLAKLREQVLEANLSLVRRGLVIATFGNVSGIAREEKLIVIKPSGVHYNEMKLEHLVVTDLEGKVVEGALRPSSDLPTHTILYKKFPGIGGVAHTHSEYATAWAQARKAIPCYGTTHADYFHGPIPVTKPMREREIKGEYEANTGNAIVRAFQKIDPMAVPGVLVANHGPFTWGGDAEEAAEHAWMLEAIARLAHSTIQIRSDAEGVGKSLHDRHFLRKHGDRAYYGQPGRKS